jgi:hypothetical protein
MFTIAKFPYEKVRLANDSHNLEETRSLSSLSREARLGLPIVI